MVSTRTYPACLRASPPVPAPTHRPSAPPPLRTARPGYTRTSCSRPRARSARLGSTRTYPAGLRASPPTPAPMPPASAPSGPLAARPVHTRTSCSKNPASRATYSDPSLRPEPTVRPSATPASPRTTTIRASQSLGRGASNATRSAWCASRMGLACMTWPCGRATGG